MLYTKKELHLYREIIKTFKKDFKNNFPYSIVVESLSIILEKMESIEYLLKKKQYNSARTLFRPTFQSIANLRFILDNKNEIPNRALAYNAWCLQNYAYKINGIINESDIPQQTLMEKEYMTQLENYYSISDISIFEDILTQQRNFYYTKKNKKYWYNIIDIYTSEEDFFKEFLGKESSFFYKIYSENVHGNDSILSLGNRNIDNLNVNDESAIFLIEYYFHQVIADTLNLVPSLEKYDPIISSLSDYRQRMNKMRKAGQSN